MYGLAGYLKYGLFLHWTYSYKPFWGFMFTYLCFQLVLFHPMTCFFFLYRSPSCSLCTLIDTISSNKDKVLPIYVFPNSCNFGDFNARHNGWLTNPQLANSFITFTTFLLSSLITIFMDLLFWIYLCLQTLAFFLFPYRLVGTLRNVAFFLISSMVFSLLVQ